MRKFNLAVWQLGIVVFQLNVWNPERRAMELRRYHADGTWSVIRLAVFLNELRQQG